MPDATARPNIPRFPNPAARPSVRYAFAVLVVVAGWAAREALTPLWGPTAIPFIFFYPAIVIAAWYGRRGPALLAIVLSTLAADYFFIEPRHSLLLHHPSEAVAMAAFVLVDIFLVSAIEVMHIARARLATELAQRLHTEAQLAAEKELLATTLTSMGDAVLVTDAAGNVTSLNREAERLTGWSTAEAAGNPHSIVFRIINENTREPADNPIDRALSLGIVTGLANHTVLIAKDGREIPIDDSAAPIRQPGENAFGVVLVFRDVTEQRRAQRDRARLAEIVKYSGDAIMTKDLNGIIKSWNDSACRLFGYEAEEIIGQPVTVLFPADRLHEEDYILERLRAGQPCERIETVRVAKDGRHISVSLSVSPLKNAEGEVVGASKIIHDVSELVAAREELAREKELLATTLASIGDGVIVTDAEGRVTFLNDEAEKLTGWVKDDARGRPLTEVFKIINEATRAMVENPVDKVMRYGGVVGLANHTVLIAKDGREIPIDDSAAPIRQPGGPLWGVVLVFRDFTDRKLAEQTLRESEERYRTLVDTANEGVWYIDLEGTTIYLNEPMAALLGTEAREVIGRKVGEFCFDEDISKAQARIGSNLKGNYERFDFRFRKQDGSEALVLASTSPVRDTNGKVIGALGMFADITDRKLAEKERERLLKSEQELRAAAEEANRLKDEFLAIMSHELRNPLNVILGYSELLVRAGEMAQSPPLLRMAEAIKRNAVAQSKLIRDLLDLSRLRNGKLDLNKEVVSMMMAVNNAVDTVRADAEAKQIPIQISAADEDLFVEGDPVRLEQIVWNILNNAVKFTPPGGKIDVRLGREGEEIALVVEDTGEGIDHAFVPHIFEMFRQSNGGTNRPHAGMGIGLAVVSQLAQLHGGSVEAHSDGLGQGSRFTVRLPRCLQGQPKIPLVTDLSAIALSDMKVLVVDDSEDTAEMLKAILALSGANVIPATSGDVALRIAAETEFDVILSDISMPGMDGFEFLKRLNTLPTNKDVPVLALTGFGRPEDIQRAQAEGFFSHVTKPFDLGVLMDVLQKLPRKNSDETV